MQTKEHRTLADVREPVLVLDQVVDVDHQRADDDPGHDQPRPERVRVPVKTDRVANTQESKGLLLLYGEEEDLSMLTADTNQEETQRKVLLK